MENIDLNENLVVKWLEVQDAISTLKELAYITPEGSCAESDHGFNGGLLKLVSEKLSNACNEYMYLSAGMVKELELKLELSGKNHQTLEDTIESFEPDPAASSAESIIKSV